MSAGDIRAGRAYVELMLNDKKFLKGLRNAGDRLKNFGTGVAQIGAGMMAAGAAITTPLLAAVKQFAATGDQLDKMRARTGFTAEALSGLGFAAEQGGASIDQLDKSLAAMARFSIMAERGLATATDVLDMLGVSLNDFQSADPEEKFKLLAESISQVEDPTKRAGLALKVFGRSGRELLPMLAGGRGGIEELQKEAEELGLVVSEESATMAANVTDAFNRIYRATGAVVYEIGFSLSDVILEATGLIKNLVVGVNRWVKQNRELVKMLFYIGVGLTAAGAAVVALGGVAFAAGMAMTGLATAISAVATAAGLLLSPIGLVTAAVVAGTAVWAIYTDSGKKAVNGLMGSLNSLLGFAKNVFGGIYDAIRGGNLQLAGEIAMAGLKVVWLKGLETLNQITGNFIGKFGSQLMSGDLLGAMQTFSLKWVDNQAMVAEVLVGLFTKAANAVVDAWRQATTQISSMILELAASEGILGDFTRQVLGVDLKPGDLAGAKRIASSNITQQADFGKSAVNSLSGRLQSGIRSVREPIAAYMADGAGSSADIAQAEALLARLTEQARQATEAARADEATRQQNIAGSMEGVGRNMPNFTGSFSAAALSAVGGNGSPMERTAKAAEKTEQAIRQLITDNNAGNEKLLQELRIGGMIA